MDLCVISEEDYWSMRVHICIVTLLVNLCSATISTYQQIIDSIDKGKKLFKKCSVNGLALHVGQRSSSMFMRSSIRGNGGVGMKWPP